MANQPVHKEIAVVILENGRGEIALQLRDDKPTIPHPDQWALFGGHIEAGERPFDAALREVAEELTIQLLPRHLAFLNTFEIEQQKAHHLFHYPVNSELDKVCLTEGQRSHSWSPQAIQQGTLDGKRIVSAHLTMLHWYWQLERL